MLMLFASAPELSDPIWAVMLDAGLAAEWVARLKVAAYGAGAIAVAYGRAVAGGPLVGGKG